MLANKRRMPDFAQRLNTLRARIDHVKRECDEKYGFPAEMHPSGETVGSRFAMDWMPGEEVATRRGKHFETETFYPRHRRHGCVDIGDLFQLPSDLLASIFENGESSEAGVTGVPPSEWAFLDTETTGLMGSASACAFLVGVGRITAEGFRVRQFFMRDFAEESSVLEALREHLRPFRVLITYNGRTFDQPLLETRYRLHRSRSPLTAFAHVDLLFSARRLWKLRFDSRRLVDLEQQILGVERQGDVPGALIPYVYFEYVRTREMARLLPVFHHNATDILTLACLTGIVPLAFQDGPGLSERFTNGAELIAIARWLREAGKLERARELLRRAIETQVPDGLLFRTLWDLAALEQKLDCGEAALEIWNDLTLPGSSFRVEALEEIAKFHEHRSKDLAKALEATREALRMDDSEGLRKREERLLRRLTRRKTGEKKSHR